MKIKKNINTTIEYLQNRIKTLNSLMAAGLFVIFLVNVWLMYEFLEYLSKTSIIVMMGAITILMAAMFLTIRGLAKTMYAAFQRYSTHLETLLKDIRDMRNIPYTDVLLEKTLQSAMDLIEADAGAVFLAEDNKLVPGAIVGDKSVRPNDEAIDKGCGAAGLAIERGFSIVINDIGQDHRFQKHNNNAGVPEDAGSLLSVPVKFRSETFGAIVLVRKKGNQGFSSEEQHLIEFLAAQVGAGLEHARFHEIKKNYEIHFTNILIEAIENINGKKGHAKRIARYTLMMADDLGFGFEDKKKLYRAALLHDIGFVRLNPKKISSRSQFRQHVELGYDMLNPIDLYHDIAPFVLHHHERYDGRGYPKGLKGEDIPLESRILFVAEAFDAMVSSLSYKNTGTMLDGLPGNSTIKIQEALEELERNAGTQFDPKVVNIFVRKFSDDDMQELAEEVTNSIMQMKALAA